MDKKILNITPVLPSLNIAKDVKWHKQYTGFTCLHHDEGYAVLKRGEFYLHLQWHADTKDDPLLGGSVIKIFVKDIKPFFNEFVDRGTIKKERLRLNTPWMTHEFGFYDLNKNAIFFVQDA